MLQLPNIVCGGLVLIAAQLFLSCSASQQVAIHVTYSDRLQTEEIKSFVKKHRKYQIEESSLPELTKVTESNIPLRWELSEQHDLMLALGRRKAVEHLLPDSTPHWRTDSYYKLSDNKWLIPTFANSVFAYNIGKPTSDFDIQVFTNDDRSLILISESLDSTTRNHLLSRNTMETHWSCKQLDIPILPIHRREEHERLQGIDNKFVYLEDHGIFYRFPIKKLITPSQIAYPKD